MFDQFDTYGAQFRWGQAQLEDPLAIYGLLDDGPRHLLGQGPVGSGFGCRAGRWYGSTVGTRCSAFHGGAYGLDAIAVAYRAVFILLCAEGIDQGLGGLVVAFY